jgi:hypothetical protein
MPPEQWLSSQQAVEIARNHVKSSIGRAQAIVRDALASGEVRTHRPAAPVLLTADDGIVGMDMRPGWLKATESPQLINRDDLLDWLDRNHPSAATAAQPKGKGGRPPKFDRAAVTAEVRRLMDHHGEFSADDPEWNAQARLIEALRLRFGEASDSTLEEYMKKPLATWRDEKAASPKT